RQAVDARRQLAPAVTAAFPRVTRAGQQAGGDAADEDVNGLQGFLDGGGQFRGEELLGFLVPLLADELGELQDQRREDRLDDGALHERLYHRAEERLLDVALQRSPPVLLAFEGGHDAVRERGRHGGREVVPDGARCGTVAGEGVTDALDDELPETQGGGG